MRTSYAIMLSAPIPVATRGGDLPRRIQVLQWGDNPNVTGRRIHVGATLISQLAHPLYAWRRVPIDFEHNTLAGTPEFKASAEPRPIAGYGDIECIPGDGVYLANIDYTPQGLAAAANYACVSAAPVPDPQGDVIAILSVALCRNGAVPGMQFKSVPLSAGAAEQLGLTQPAPEQSRKMNYKEALCKMLDLDPATATDEDIAAAIAAAKKPEAPPANEPPKAEAVPLAATIAQVVGRAIQPIVDQVANVRMEFAKRDKDAVLAEARAAGKVVPLSADAIGALTLAQLKDVVTATPSTVPLSARTPETLRDETRDAGPNAAQTAIARNCGVDPAKVWPKNAGGISIRLALGIVAAVSMLGVVAIATAADRDTPEREGREVVLTAGAAINAGMMMAVSNLVAYEAADVAGYVVLGRAENAAAVGAKVTARRGVFRWDNDGTFTVAHIGTRCYVKDRDGVTTAATAANDIPAGYIVDVDSTGVWVDTYNDTPLISTSVASLAVAGALTVGTTIDGASITVDAGAGIDTQSAGELKVGAATATSLTLGASDITTAVAGPLTAPRITAVLDATATRVMTSADYGKLIVVTNGAAIAMTLPANGAPIGTWIDVAIGAQTGAGDNNSAPTISAATTDTLVGPNDVDLKSVTWATAHRIGAYARFWSDGEFWHVLNLGGTTMTYTD